MKHLIRAAGVLVAIIVIVFVLPKVVPAKTFVALQSYGFYREQDNTQEWAQFPLQYADPVRCNSCHEDKHSSWISSEHKSVSCENCHGPGELHIENGSPLVVVNTSKDLCKTCHAEVIARPADFPQVDIQVHGNQTDCITCHNPHSPKTEIPVIAHKVEGFDDCLLCHKTGGLKPFPIDHKERSIDTCLNCHQNY